MNTKLSGFLMVPDCIREKLGVTAALVFGLIYRYASGQDGECYASQSRLAEELGLTRQTVNAHIATLVEEGYIDDLTPGRRNRPHTYRVTDAVFVRTVVEVGEREERESASAAEDVMDDVSAAENERLLIEFGIWENVAAKLAHTVDTEELRHWIKYARKADNPQALLTRALKDGWTLPDGHDGKVKIDSW